MAGAKLELGSSVADLISSSAKAVLLTLLPRFNGVGVAPNVFAVLTPVLDNCFAISRR